VETKNEEGFNLGDMLEAISFSVKGLTIKGRFISIDDRNNVTVEMANGTRVIFKKSNLRKTK
jgi:hypothetical protein